MAETPDGLISGRYRLGELLGTGGSASVFAAVDTAAVETAVPDPRRPSHGERPATGVPRAVALKILHPHLSGSAEAREAFFAEALAAERLHHPNIVEVLGVGVHDPDGDEPQAWIALEHAPGTSLAEEVERRGRLSVGETLAVADGVLAALGYAHEAGLIHRDVSPANIMIARDPRGVLRASGVRLVDFGLADAAGRTAAGTDLLRSGLSTAVTRADRAPASVVGNVNYLSPEHARGEPVDERGDLYQLGAVLYFALVGRPPFVRETRRAVMLAQLQAPPPVPSVARPGIPRAVDRMIVKALLKDPALRYPGAAAMQTAVRAAIAHLPSTRATQAGRADAGDADPEAITDAVDGSLADDAQTTVLPSPALPGAGSPDDRTAVLRPVRPAGSSRRGGTSAGSGRPSGPEAAAWSGRAGGSGPAEGAGPPGWSGSAAGSGPSTWSGPAAGSGRAGAPGPAASRAPGLGLASSALTGSGAPGAGARLSTRGSAALWGVVGAVAVVAVIAWTLAMSGSPSSTFAADPAAGATADASTTAPAPTSPLPAAQPTIAPAAAPLPEPVAATVPATASTSLDAATAALATAGLGLGAVSLENSPSASGTVLRSDPAPGTALAQGGTVNLVVASGSNQVPSVSGVTRDEAVAALRSAGFDVLLEKREDAGPAGMVLATTPVASAVLPLGSTVTVVVAVPRTGGNPSLPAPTATGGPTATPTSVPGTPTSTPPPR